MTKFNKTIIIFFNIIFISCAQNATKSIKSVEEEVLFDEIQLSNSPGKVKKLNIPIVSSAKVDRLICDNNEIPFYTRDNQITAFLGESYFSEKKGYTCHVVVPGVTNKHGQKIATVSIRPFDYPKERLRVNKRKVVLSKKDQKRVEKEWLMLKEIYKDQTPYPYFEENFEIPLDTYITSKYGTRRIFNNLKKTQHLGNDFRASIGVPIPVSNRGKVVFAGNLFYSGNTVIVDHGVGIFTTYGHLSKILVSTGDIIHKNGVIGHAGATGRVTGPHLHWGVKIHGNWVDGISLVQEGI